MRKRLTMLLIAGVLLIAASCSKEVSVDTAAKQDNAPQASAPIVENTQMELSENQKTAEGFEQITREQAGLSTIPVKDISGIMINSRIGAILNGDKYIDSDYASGIVQEYSGLVISERFTQEIIGNIKIGSNINDVVGLLGEPSAKEGDYLFYKTNKVYIAFKGTDKVEASILAPVPKSYDKEILNKLLSVFDTKDAKDLLSVLQEDDNINEFFEVDGHIHGGGWYADSDNGISVEDFDEFTITVYNNFEGNLYKPNDILIYENKDYMFEKLRRGLEGYYIINEEFKDAGVLSPNGKYNSIYEWDTSDSHFFIIRTMDYSRPDFPIGAPAGEYKWINDDYLLYLDAYSTLPFAIRASEDSESQAINIFYVTGLIKTNDSTEGMGINDIEIADIKDNMIQLKDKESGKKYQFQYTVSPDGRLDFKYLNN